MTVPKDVAKIGLASEWLFAKKIIETASRPGAKRIAVVMLAEIEHRASKRQRRVVTIAKAPKEAQARFGPANPSWKRKESVYDRLH